MLVSKANPPVPWSLCYWQVMLRTKELCLVRVTQVALCALGLGTVFLHVGASDHSIQVSIHNKQQSVANTANSKPRAHATLSFVQECTACAVMLHLFNTIFFLAWACQDRMGFLAFSMAFLLTSSMEALPLFLKVWHTSDSARLHSSALVNEFH